MFARTETVGEKLFSLYLPKTAKKVLPFVSKYEPHGAITHVNIRKDGDDLVLEGTNGPCMIMLRSEDGKVTDQFRDIPIPPGLVSLASGKQISIHKDRDGDDHFYGVGVGEDYFIVSLPHNSFPNLELIFSHPVEGLTFQISKPSKGLLRGIPYYNDKAKAVDLVVEDGGIHVKGADGNRYVTLGSCLGESRPTEAVMVNADFLAKALGSLTYPATLSISPRHHAFAMATIGLQDDRTKICVAEIYRSASR